MFVNKIYLGKYQAMSGHFRWFTCSKKFLYWLLLKNYDVFKILLISSCSDAVSRLGVGKKLRWDIAGTADPDHPKSYPIPYNTMFTNKSWEVLSSKVSISCGVAGHWSAWGRWWVIAFTWLVFSSLIPHSAVFNFTPKFSCFCFLTLSPVPLQKWGSGCVEP